MRITRGQAPLIAVKCCIYGPEGIGKTTFAAQFPSPVFIDTEDSTKYMDVPRFDKPTSWAMLLDEVRYVRDTPGVCGTLVLDTADWAEQLCAMSLLARDSKKGLEDYGYGKGYVYLSEEFGRLLNLLSEVADRGVNVVITAHAKMRKFEQPDEMGAYDRWEMKLSRQVGPMVKEWADMVLFANYKTYAVKPKEGKAKAQGGKRVMYTSHHPCWDAKNRQGLAEELPFTFDAIREHIPNASSLPAPATPAPAPDPVPSPVQDPVMPPAPPPPPPAAPVPQTEGMPYPTAPLPEGAPAYLKPLYDLMNASNIYPEEVEAACVTRGYAPQGMPLTEYPEDFVTGCLVAAWDQVFDMIIENRPVPF